jgi:hypothetical protein
MVSAVQAGSSYRAGKTTTPQPQPVPAPAKVQVAPPTITIAVVAEPARPEKEPLVINLRGPDGQVRRFAVEGGREAIHVRSVILRPGQSVTIRWTPAR